MTAPLRTAGVVLAAILWFAPGCAAPPVWKPGATHLDQAVEIPIELPARGIPGFILERFGDGPEDVSLAVLDTGAPATVVTSRYAARHKLKSRPTSRTFRDVQGKQLANVRAARVPAMTIGGATFREFDAIVADLPAMRAIHPRVDVVLGRTQFAQLLLTIDYPRRRLVFERGELPAPNGTDVLALRRGAGGELLVPARLLGEDASLELDTGQTSDGLVLSRYRLIAMPWAATPVDAYRVQTFLGQKLLRLGRMNGDVTLGHHALRRPIIGISFDDDVELIGSAALRHFVVTIDQRNDRVRLARPTTRPIESPPVQRLGLTLLDDSGAAEPLPGSDAERTGLRRGDRILSINGVAPRGWSSDFLQQLEEAGQPLDVRVSRNGSELRLVIPLTTLVP